VGQDQRRNVNLAPAYHALILIEIVAAVREAIGRDLALGVRLCGDELIDDGITDRGHRKNILDAQVKLVGASCGPHKSFRVMCDIVHAGGFVEHDK